MTTSAPCAIIKKRLGRESDIMGCIYAGFDYKNRVNGYFKIGESGKPTPAQRLQQIRRTDCFQCLAYLLLKNDSKAERLFVESYVRMKLEQRFAELTHVQNDHFTYQIKSKQKYEQAQQFADMAITFAQEACQVAGVQCEIGKRKYKRG